jgi:hypothetical protein
MLIDYALGRLGVQQAREVSHSALPNAPIIPDRPPWPATVRARTAGALYRLAYRIGPVDTSAGHRALRQA